MEEFNKVKNIVEAVKKELFDESNKKSCKILNELSVAQQSICGAISSVDMNVSTSNNNFFQNFTTKIDELNNTKEFESIKSSIESFKVSVLSNIESLMVIKEEKQNAIAKVEQLSNEINAQILNLSNKNNKIASLEQQNEILKNTKSSLGNDIKKLEKEINTIQNRVNKQETNFLEEKRIISESHKASLAAKDDEIIQLQNSNVLLVSKFKKKEEEFTKESQMKKSDIDKLSLKIQDVEEKLTKSTEFAQSKILELNKLQKEIKSNSLLFEKSQKKAEKELEEFINTATENKKLKINLDNAFKERNSLEKKATELQSKLSLIKSEFQNLKDTNKLIEKSLEENTIVLHNMTDQCLENEEEIENLKKSVEESKYKIGQKDTLISELKELVAELQQKNKDPCDLKKDTNKQLNFHIGNEQNILEVSSIPPSRMSTLIFKETNHFDDQIASKVKHKNEKLHDLVSTDDVKSAGPKKKPHPIISSKASNSREAKKRKLLDSSSQASNKGSTVFKKLKPQSSAQNPFAIADLFSELEPICVTKAKLLKK